jgi:hypothetical protein
MKKSKQLFIVRKYIMATDVQDAIRLDKTKKPDDVLVDDDWRKAHMLEPETPIGFKQKDGGQKD